MRVSPLTGSGLLPFPGGHLHPGGHGEGAEQLPALAAGGRGAAEEEDGHNEGLEDLRRRRNPVLSLGPCQAVILTLSPPQVIGSSYKPLHCRLIPPHSVPPPPGSSCAQTLFPVHAVIV